MPANLWAEHGSSWRCLHWRRSGARTSASNRTEVELNRSADMAWSSWASAQGSRPAADPHRGAPPHGRRKGLGFSWMMPESD